MTAQQLAIGQIYRDARRDNGGCVDMRRRILDISEDGELVLFEFWSVAIPTREVSLTKTLPKDRFLVNSELVL